MSFDISFQREGLSIVLLRVHTDRGREWLETSVHAEDWQRLGADSVAVDVRMVESLVAAALGTGLVIKGGF